MAQIPTGNLPQDRRVRRLVADAPPGTVFEGYGGTARYSETLVFYVPGVSPEVRIPVWPSRFPSEEVAHEYGCIAGDNWADVLDRIESDREIMQEERTNR